MRSYICLILDKQCQVIFATILRGTVPGVTKALRRMMNEKDAWGYEIWADAQRVVASYDCVNPPSRAQLWT